MSTHVCFYDASTTEEIDGDWTDLPIPRVGDKVTVTQKNENPEKWNPDVESYRFQGTVSEVHYYYDRMYRASIRERCFVSVFLVDITSEGITGQ